MGRLAGHFDRFRRTSDLELPVHASGSISGNRGILHLKSLEARCLRSNIIRIGNKVGDTVITVGVSGSRVASGFGGRRHGDFRIRHRRAGRVGNSSENAAEDGLAGGWGRPEANGEREYCQGGQSD